MAKRHTSQTLSHLHNPTFLSDRVLSISFKVKYLLCDCKKCQVFLAFLRKKLFFWKKLFLFVWLHKLARIPLWRNPWLKKNHKKRARADVNDSEWKLKTSEIMLNLNFCKNKLHIQDKPSKILRHTLTAFQRQIHTLWHTCWCEMDLRICSQSWCTSSWPYW